MADLEDDPLEDITTQDILLTKIAEMTNENDILVKRSRNLTTGMIVMGIMFVGVLIWGFSVNK